MIKLLFTFLLFIIPYGILRWLIYLSERFEWFKHIKNGERLHITFLFLLLTFYSISVALITIKIVSS